MPMDIWWVKYPFVIVKQETMDVSVNINTLAL